MTDANNTLGNLDKNLGDSFDAASNSGQPFYKDIVDYKTADPATKARMDELIATLDTKDLNTLTAYGEAPTNVLKESSQEILGRAQTAASFLGGFSALKDKLANFDFKTVGSLAKGYTKKIERQISLANLNFKTSPAMYVIHKIGAFFGQEKTNNAAAEKIRHEIDKSMLQFTDVVADLETAKAKIPGVMTDLQTLENARLQAYSEYGVYIGAALEKLDRIRQEIPALQTAAADSPMKQGELRNMRNAMTVLNSKITVMDTFHKTGLLQLGTIDDLQQSLSLTQLNIDNHLSISQGQWTAFLAESATAVAVSRIAESVQAADEFGRKIIQQSQSMADMTKEMVRASFSSGAVNAEMVVGYLNKRSEEIREGLKFMDAFNAQQDVIRAQLDQAGRDYRAAAIQVEAAPKEAVKLLVANTSEQPRQKLG